MNRLIQKLDSKRGETLVEMLTSIALLALSSAILLGMLSAAYQMNAAAREEHSKYYAELAAAEAQTEPLSSSTNKVVIKDGVNEVEISVNFYGSYEDGGLRSYKYIPQP